MPIGGNHPLQGDNASALPVLFLTAFRVAKRSSDKDFHNKAFDMLYNYLKWWKNERTDEKTGLITSLFEETFPPYLGYAGEYSGVDTNVAVAIGAKICGEFAEFLGKKDISKECFLYEKEIYKKANKYLWDEEEGLFRPLNLKTMTFGARTAQGFYMLADENLPNERKEKLLKNLKGENFNWSNTPVTSVSIKDSTYQLTKTENYQFNASWSGMVWTLINKFIVFGLKACNLTEDKNYLTMKTVELTSSDCREFYAPDTKTGYGANDYAWTGAHSLCLFLEELLGIDYNGFTNTLNINPQIDDEVKITGLCLSENLKIDLLIKDKKVIEVKEY